MSIKDFLSVLQLVNALHQISTIFRLKMRNRRVTVRTPEQCSLSRRIYKHASEAWCDLSFLLAVPLLHWLWAGLLICSQPQNRSGLTHNLFPSKYGQFKQLHLLCDWVAKPSYNEARKIQFSLSLIPLTLESGCRRKEYQAWERLRDSEDARCRARAYRCTHVRPHQH